MEKTERTNEMEEPADCGSFISHIRRLLLVVLEKGEDEIRLKNGSRLIICGGSGDLQLEFCAEELYERYRAGERLECIAGDIVTAVREFHPNKGERIRENKSAYEKIKEKLMIRAVSYEKNQKDMEKLIFHRIGDIALVLYRLLLNDGEKLLTLRVEKEFPDVCGIAESEIWKQALQNTLLRFPPRIYSFPELMEELEDEETGDFMTRPESIELYPGYWGSCLSNTLKVNGATSIFLPGVAERLSELLEDDLYIAFTSIHEAMIHRAGCTAAEMIQKAMKGMEDFLSEDGSEFLSSHVYRYSRREARFYMLESLP